MIDEPFLRQPSTFGRISVGIIFKSCRGVNNFWPLCYNPVLTEN